jgi:hypothetical protein
MFNTKPFLFVSSCLFLAVAGVSCGDGGTGTSEAPPTVDQFVHAQGEDVVTIQNIEVDGTNFELTGGKLFIWGGTNSNLLFRVDYAGTDLGGLNDFLERVHEPPLNPGTSYEGTVSEVTIAEKQVQVTVAVKTHHALSFIVDISGYPEACTVGGITFFTLCPTVFGYNILDLAQGRGMPVLGESDLEFKYVAPARGADIPDAVTLLSNPPEGFEFKSFTLHAEATGTLREAFDDGSFDGVRAFATVDVDLRPSEDVDSEIVEIEVLGR